MANGIWANGVLAQAKLCGAKFGERRPRERALNAVTNHYKCRDGRWLILSLLNEERQWPTLARCLGREDLITDRQIRHQGRPPRPLAGTDQDCSTRFLPPKTSPNGARVLDGNGLVFGVVGILDDIPTDRQMIDNDVLVPFENDTMLTVNSPIWIDGSAKDPPRHPPERRRAQRRGVARGRLRRGRDPAIARIGRGGMNHLMMRRLFLRRLEP